MKSIKGKFSHCSETVNHSRIKVEENKRKAVFKNPDRLNYEKSTVDGCLITKGIRSDYLVSKKGVASVLVELKGGNVEHACDQLIAAVEHPHVRPLLEEKLGFLVICSKYPRFDTFVRRAKTRCAREYQAGFHVVCDKGEFDIERVAAIDGPF